VKEFYNKIGSEKWQEIIKSANIQNISNIFNALSKINDKGESVKEFHDEIITPERLYEMLRISNESELVTIIKNLANTEEGAEKLRGIYDNTFTKERSKKIIEDKDSRNIGHILVSFCKSPEAKTIIMSLLENEGWMGKKFEKSHDSHKDFIDIPNIMCALDEVKNGNKELVETFYEKTKHNYTKTGDELKQSYSNINEGNATLLDLHGFTHKGAKIVIKTFLDNMGKNGNPFYIECGKGTHSSGENKNNKMNEILKEALREGKEFKRVSAVGNESYFKIEKLSIAPSTSANLGRGNALATNTKGVGASKD
jgi:hypothetical protein